MIRRTRNILPGIMKTTSESWSQFYESDGKHELLIPESFIARIFLSHRPIDALDDYLFKDKKILDVGAGHGRHVWFFNQLGMKVFGTEVSVAALKRLQEAFPEHVFEKCPSRQIAFNSSTFDYVVAVNSIYYVEHQEDSILENLKETFRVLKSGGVLVCSFVGYDHFILKGAVYLKNKNALIKNTGHQCKEDIVIRPMSSKNDITNTLSAIDDVEVKMIGEITDELEGFTRHLYYLIAEKK